MYCSTITYMMQVCVVRAYVWVCAHKCVSKSFLQQLFSFRLHIITQITAHVFSTFEDILSLRGIDKLSSAQSSPTFFRIICCVQFLLYMHDSGIRGKNKNSFMPLLTNNHLFFMPRKSVYVYSSACYYS